MAPEDFIVLYAEDNEHDIIATKRSWKRHGVELGLRITRDGAECLDYLYRRGAYAPPADAPSPSLVLLDLHMPKVGGLEVLKTIREDPKHKHLPVVVMTSSSMDRDRIESYELGVNAYVIKPLVYEKFAEAIASILEFWKMVEPASGEAKT